MPLPTRRNSSQIRRTRLTEWLPFICIPTILYGLLAVHASAEEVSKEDIQQLRLEMQALKTDYETRIRSLEEQLRQTEAKVEQARPSAPAASSAPPSAAPAASPTPQTGEGKTPTPAEKLEAPILPPYGGILLNQEPPAASLEFHGYMRSGGGIDDKGGYMESFIAPEAFGRYRLGNEPDTYFEPAFKYNILKMGDDPAVFDMQLRLGIDAFGQETAAPQPHIFELHEAFVEGKDVIPGLPGATIWAGERHYRREDVDINDFFFFDMRGHGGGIEDVQLGPAKLALAYLASSRDDAYATFTRIPKENIDLRLYDIGVLWGRLMLWGNYAWIREGNGLYNAQSGGAFGFMHSADTPFDGLNTIAVQYGTGPANSFTASGFLPPVDQVDPRHNFRVTELYTFQPAEFFAVQSDAIYQNFDNGGGHETWISLGSRPTFYFTKHLGLAFEGGWDYVDNQEENYSGSLFKFTISPQISLSNEFFSRPVLRLFFTYAFWSDGFKGRVGGPAYSNALHGLSVGIQTETWW